ncbi:L-glutamine:2-deoxy-scyllo-inosose aminotransferase [Planctomycetes bacterium MalM25]|nr:L-glutamine:2-deoxy-scyllo-inosose aminotransferase [Planctomycetes bacterium MalM25]
MKTCQPEEHPTMSAGKPRHSAVSAAWPRLDDQQIEAATRVLRSGRLNYWTGEEGRRFEQEFADYHNRRHAVALSNGTVALELALIAFGIGPGDEVIVPSRTFIATASAVAIRGAKPVFADIDHESQNLTACTASPLITPRTKAIICVHLAGWPCELDALQDLAKEQGLILIEDCAQAHGARYRGEPVGSFGHAAAFSFCQDKIMTTAGEGGMLLLNDTDAWQKAWSYKDHGKSWEAVHERQHPPGFRWLHDSFGTNWRMTEVQSAIGRLQLRKLDQWVSIRRSNAMEIVHGIAPCSALRTPTPPRHIDHAYYKLYSFVDQKQLRAGWDRDRILHTLAEHGQRGLSGSCSEIYREHAVPADWRPVSARPVAKQLGDASLMFLCDPTISPNEMQATCRTVRNVMELASKPSRYAA